MELEGVIGFLTNLYNRSILDGVEQEILFESINCLEDIKLEKNKTINKIKENIKGWRVH